MKISTKHVKAFNAGVEPTFNPHYNKAHDLPTLEQDALFYKVQYSNSGLMKEPITKKMVLEYLELNPGIIDQLKEKFARFYK